MAPSLPPPAHFHFPFPYKYLLPCHPLLPRHHSPQAQAQAPHHSSASEEGKARQGKPKHPHSQRLRAEHSCPAADLMSRGSKGGRGGGLDLKLHLSPPAPETLSSDEEWSSSSPSSCLSSEGEREQRSHGLLQWSDSPEATSMVLAACPRCLMYVMLSEADPRCPRCRSPVLLDFLHHAARNSTRGGGINVSRGEDDGDHSRNSSRGGGGRNRRA